MKVLLFARKSLLTQRGGDTVQVEQSLTALTQLKHEVHLCTDAALLPSMIAQHSIEVLYTFNLGRLADQMACLRVRQGHPKLIWVIASIWIDYGAYEKQRAAFWSLLPSGILEWLKTCFRAGQGRDNWPPLSTLRWHQALHRVAWAADAILCTTSTEQKRVRKAFNLGPTVHVMSPGLEQLHSKQGQQLTKQRKGWLVIGRIEGIKNQVQAAKAWGQLAQRGSEALLTFMGDQAPNHSKHSKAFRQAIDQAKHHGAKIQWLSAGTARDVSEALSQAEGVIIPSLFETFGLVAIEALAKGCKVILSNNAESAKELEPYVALCNPEAEGIAAAFSQADFSSKKPFDASNYQWLKSASQLEGIVKHCQPFVAISGSRGLPNRHGGYEEMVEHVAKGLADQGFRVLVSTSSAHPVKQWAYPGIDRRMHWDPEPLIGSIAQFIYDAISLRHIARTQPDAHLTLGTTTSAPLLPLAGKIPLAVHMDGLEWMRGKYRPLTQAYLRKAEQWAAHRATVIVSDNPGISEHIKSYPTRIEEIAYGVHAIARVDDSKAEAILKDLHLRAEDYALILCRIEPENNLDMALQALLPSCHVAVVGNWATSHGKQLKKTYQDHPHFLPIDATYDSEVTQSLRQGCRLYVHGHSAGGTNPGLLQAMAAGCPIAAHDNPFNRHVLGVNGSYFNNETFLHSLYTQSKSLQTDYSSQLISYQWSAVIDDYAALFQNLNQ